MQETIKSIRQAFSKGNVLISNTGISVIFTGKQEIAQSLNTYAGNFCWVFKDLIDNCDSCSLKFCGKSIRLEFNIPGISSETIAYPPIIPNNKREEFNANANSDDIPDIARFLSTVDLNDSEEILGKLNDFFSLESKARNSNIVSFQDGKSVRCLTKLAEEFESDYTEINITQPVYGEFDGSVDVLFDSAGGNLKIDGNLKDTMSKLISLSSNVDIEIGTEFDSATFVFYV